MAIYYNYNNVKVLVNNQFVIADSLSFSLSASISDHEEIDRKGGFTQVADGGLTTTVSLSYFVAGTDPLFSFLNSTGAIPLQAGGMTLQKGYLTSYSITAATHGPVKVSASLQFYEDFGGSFNAETVDNASRDYLKFSDMDLTFSGINATSNIVSLNYSLSNNIEPQYEIGDLTPRSVKFGKKVTSLSLDTFNFQEGLTYNGKDVTVTFTLGPQAYTTAGKIKTKDVAIGFGEKILANLSIDSSSYGGAPTITNDSPSGGALNVGQTFTITGTNLGSTTAVYFNNNIKANDFVSISDTEIKVKIPRFAKNGPYKVITAGGEIVRPVIQINSAFIP
jgi:hypothetical protein